MDVISLGELLIDFISSDHDTSIADSSGFVKSPGGAPANVACGAARLGSTAGFIGKVGRDPFGDFLEGVLVQNGVDTSFLIRDEYARTTLSFVARRPDGHRDCIFYRNPGADALLHADELSRDYFRGAQVFHFGSISLIDPQSEAATRRAIEYAKAEGLIVSYDPNYRDTLWTQQQARPKITEYFPYADIVKLSDEEAQVITGETDWVKITDSIHAHGVKIVILTLGPNGCYYSDGTTRGRFEQAPADTVETTGAGDAFVAAMLHSIVQRRRAGETPDDILRMDKAFIDIVYFANCAGALATTKFGAIPSLPTYDEVRSLYDVVDGRR